MTRRRAGWRGCPKLEDALAGNFSPLNHVTREMAEVALRRVQGQMTPPDPA